MDNLFTIQFFKADLGLQNFDVTLKKVGGTSGSIVDLL